MSEVPKIADINETGNKDGKRFKSKLKKKV